MRNSSADILYSNCSILSPDNELMFRCSIRKANWYLDRNLAEVVEKEPLVIKLLFKPKGRGHADDPYYLQDRESLCVVCGSKENLSRHHVVPYCYRRCLSHLVKFSYHDVLPVCEDCHVAYERKPAWRLKVCIAKRFDAPLHGNMKLDKSNEEIAACRAAATLLSYNGVLPASRRVYLLKRVIKFLKHIPKPEELRQLADRKRSKPNGYLRHGDIVLSKITDVEKFFKMWRRHFVLKMKPQHLPPFWSLDKPAFLHMKSG